nr:hypothetical protein [Micromonospora sp. DSM 115978]
MKLHRDDRGSRRLAGIATGYAVVALLVGGAFALLGARLTIITVIVWGSGAFFLLVGALLFLSTLRRFQLVLNETGLIVHVGGCDFEGTWAEVDAISVEPVVLPNGTQQHLVLWVSDLIPKQGRPRFSVGGRRGYRLIEISELVESPEQLAAALRRYAGPRFRSPART